MTDQPRMEWIATKERLPEVEPCGEPGCEHCAKGTCCNSVLGLYSPGVIDAGSRYQVCATAWFHSEYFTGQPTHWQPLPPPPKESE